MLAFSEILMKTRKRMLAAAGTLAIILSGTPLASSQALAQSNTAAPDRTVEQTVSPLPQKGDTAKQFGAANDRYTVQFSAYRSLNQLYKKIPETRALVDGLKQSDETYLVPVQGAASKVSDDLYIFQDKEFGSCGSLGCAHIAFLRQSDGTFLNVLNVSIPGPIEVKNVNGEQSLLLCTHEGQYVEWKMQGSQMEPVPMPIDAKRESCTPPLDMAP